MKDVLTVFYEGDEFDEAIQEELRRRGLERGEVMIIALPESMTHLPGWNFK